MIMWLMAVSALLAYLAIASRFVLPVAQRIAAWHEREFPYLTRDKPDSAKREAVFFGFVGCLFWPLWVPLLFAVRLITWVISFPASKVRLPSEIMDEQREMERCQERMQRRIAELERELEVGS